ncbi:interferon gamma receptor 1 [Python bivittatus]|uniref:Interferon gamma receptor 1 n=1 Tax=Python bivittatus TaxID=176946 RepID=A0A9F2RAL5_PYTBI|nr:interferon gamma receptor 1 [Python bivittatus]
MRVVGPWLVLPLLGWTLCSGFSAWEPQTEVPPPKNIVVKSYNYNISVCWDYENSSSKPLFTVRITCYSTGIYEEVDTCINITQHYCDLTNKTDQCETFWVGVKALSGQHESKYNEQKFDVLRDGQIGPPKFNLSIDNHDVILNIESPLSLYEDLIDQFIYKVFLWPNGSPEERQEFIWEDCFDQTCSLPLPISSLNTSYCISVQAILSVISKAGEESEEKCISPSPKNHLGLTLLISFGTVVLLLLAVILTMVFIKLREKKITLPKSLVTVVRNQVSSAEFKSECKYDIISSTSYKPVVECEDEKSVEKLDVTEKVKTTDPSDYGKEADADDSQGIQGEGSTQEDTGAEIHENEQIHEDSIMDYSKSLTGQDTHSSLQNQDPSKADVQRSTVLGCSIKASGYDKPHWIGSSSRDEF